MTCRWYTSMWCGIRSLKIPRVLIILLPFLHLLVLCHTLYGDFTMNHCRVRRYPCFFLYAKTTNSQSLVKGHHPYIRLSIFLTEGFPLVYSFFFPPIRTLLFRTKQVPGLSSNIFVVIQISTIWPYRSKSRLETEVDALKTVMAGKDLELKDSKLMKYKYDDRIIDSGSPPNSL